MECARPPHGRLRVHPRLAFLSPEPGSGKTRALEIIQTLTPRPLITTDVSPSALFRSISDEAAGRPTILFDEIDAIFGPKAAGNEDLRSLINSGYRRTGGILRSVREGENHRVVKFPVYAALATAGLGDLPDTIMSRAVVIRMRRRAPNETVEGFRQRIHEPQGHALRDRLAAWADTTREQIDGAWPEMPDGITDRPADVWEPLIAVADAAGGHWPERARAACLALVNASKANDKGSLGIRLLADLRDAFDGAERMTSVAILERLTAMDDAPGPTSTAARSPPAASPACSGTTSPPRTTRSARATSRSPDPSSRATTPPTSPTPGCATARPSPKRPLPALPPLPRRSGPSSR